ncbi:MAG TPA: sulfite exporter TauE/SafE family protein [Bryobacteraceae bacterium]|nr:sulfite exporter TauE/SafE family protein [Bryobacteraceae bacterium]
MSLKISRAPFWCAFLCASALLLTPRTDAHPMGNFSINHYAAIHIGQQQVDLRYVIDMAEIPTFQEMQQGAFPADAQNPRVNAYVASRGVQFARGLQLMLDGRLLHLQVGSETAVFPPGAGNLPTFRMSFLYRANIPPQVDCERCELTYRDSNFDGRAGWKEIIATVGDEVSIDKSSVPAQDRSAELANYSPDLLNSPPQDLEARVTFTRELTAFAVPNTRNAKPRPSVGQSVNQPVSDIAQTAPTPKDPPVSAPRSNTPRNAFTELMNQRQISFGFMLVAAFIAAGLGALHALEPGHGKTIVAAYLVGSRGTVRHAFLLGFIVTASHTAGVYVLGAITLYAQKYILPEQIYPFLAVLSGLIIAGMGLYLVLQRSRSGGSAQLHSHSHDGHRHSHGLFGHSHEHSHGHSHDHAREHTHGDVMHSHHHHGEHNDIQPAARKRGVSARQLLLLGITGGMVPCPAALVVLLSAAALGRVGFGLFLIVCFSVGLAAVLIIMGLVAIYAGRLMSRLPTEGPLIQRWLPIGSAVMITVIGCAIAIRSLIASGVLQGRI